MARKRQYPDNILHDLKVEGMTEDRLKYDHLTERERAVIQLYYVENKLTLEEIAAEFDVSEARLKQIVQKALRKIRKKQIKKAKSM